MAQIVAAPTRIPVPGGKTIDEYVGRVATGPDGADYVAVCVPAFDITLANRDDA